MSRRSYAQPCSLSNALDRVGERWSMLIVRELALGPLRFSDLARHVGGAPTDVLSRRLRDLESDGIVDRRELGPPASATVYELTDLGRELERPMLELGRWGLNFFTVEEAVSVEPSTLPNALRVLLVPSPEAAFVVDVTCEDQTFHLHIDEGWIEASRGPADDADLAIEGDAAQIVATLVVAGTLVETTGDAALLDQLREMVTLPDELRAEAEAVASTRAEASSRTS